MRVALVLAIAAWLAGCRDGVAGGDICTYHGVAFANGATWTELCNDCSCQDGEALCTLVGCQQLIDANPSSCVSGSGCEGFGPQCGGYCCNPGEHCVNGQCACGSGSGCGNADRCGGPAMQNDCGEVCCGGTGSCPL